MNDVAQKFESCCVFDEDLLQIRMPHSTPNRSLITLDKGKSFGRGYVLTKGSEQNYEFIREESVSARKAVCIQCRSLCDRFENVTVRGYKLTRGNSS